MTNSEIKQRLEAGNNRFTSDSLVHDNLDAARRKVLSSGQQPYTIVLSCADSRVVPEMIFDTGLGELFVVRVAGNVANASSIASIEYAVAHCGSTSIVVMGHEACGAVTAAVAGGDNGYNINHLLAHISPAIHACGDGASIETIVKKNASMTVEDLKNRSSIIREAVNSGKVEILPAYYSLSDGKVTFL